MKLLILIAQIFAMLALALVSCNKANNEEKVQGNIEFTFSVSPSTSYIKSASDSGYIQGITNAVVTVEDLQGNVVIKTEKIEIYCMNGYYVSKPIAIAEGGYKICEFVILDACDNVVYASPKMESVKAQIVQTSLPLTITVTRNATSTLTPQVLSTADSRPEDFGYTSFNYNISETFDFRLGAFAFNDTFKNYKTSNAYISIYNDSAVYNNATLVYSGKLNSFLSRTIEGNNNYDTLGITTKISLPERHNNFTIEITKDRYITYRKTFTKEQLRLHYRAQDKGPLVVVLEKNSLYDGLVAYYKFDGDVLDYSGNQNNGKYWGLGLYGAGALNEVNTALDLNGTTDYVTVKSSPMLNPSQQISLCAWYYTTSFKGNGENILVGKETSFYSGYQYGISIIGNLYSSVTGEVDKRQFVFYITTVNGIFQIVAGTDPKSNFEKYELYKWYFVVGTYDGQTTKLYINGELTIQMRANGNFRRFNSDINIGKTPRYSRPTFDFTPGRIDDVKIYNRALMQSEIIKLFENVEV